MRNTCCSKSRELRLQVPTVESGSAPLECLPRAQQHYPRWLMVSCGLSVTLLVWRDSFVLREHFDFSRFSLIRLNSLSMP
ncbi:hypothetical protein CBM2609_A20020 [Cupriavidus taiwanensis]|nr:hypothetical protein CBM2604_A20019 [Cupriavidus taiwanensis]SOZ26359.1 hypothetical protein CBM2609_A20020 [Cupriavidus taiwanensis]SOZ45223.1 hypothetical protein CBM2610_A20009 [Cupriavidus taiwanensis]